MDDFWVDDTAFIGKVTAGATHEIRNVLSVIKESAGLMEDLVDINPDSLGANEEKFRRMIDNIGVQIQRGANIAKELNNLAHAPDQRLRVVDIQTVLKCQSTLYERFCRQKEISLKPESSGQGAHVETDPVRLHRLIGTIIDVMLERASSPGAMILEDEIIDENVTISLSITNLDGASQPLMNMEDHSATLDVALKLSESLGFSLELLPSEGRARLDLAAKGT
jgi:C4-dicarboxylate-specific signal transduction histidine kinase